MSVASRADFLAPAKRRYKNIPLPASGLTARIQSLMEGEKEAYESAIYTKGREIARDKFENSRRRLIVLCLVDEDGQRTLSDADLDQLRNLDGADVAHLAEACLIHCGFKDGDLEALVKNSESIHVVG